MSRCALCIWRHGRGKGWSKIAEVSKKLRGIFSCQFHKLCKKTFSACKVNIYRMLSYQGSVEVKLFELGYQRTGL